MNDGKNKSEAIYFLKRIYSDGKRYSYDKNNKPVNFGIKSVREIINEPDFPFHHKRAWFLLEKWSDNGWYDYGVTLDLDWLTDEGVKHVENIILKETLSTK